MSLKRFKMLQQEIFYRPTARLECVAVKNKRKFGPHDELNKPVTLKWLLKIHFTAY